MTRSHLLVSTIITVAAIRPVNAQRLVWASHQPHKYPPVAMAADGKGNVYLAGDTLRGVVNNANNWKIYVTKLNADHTVGYDIEIAGSTNDLPEAIAVDANGNAYLVGQTFSQDFPTTPNALPTTPVANLGRAFLTVLDTNGKVTYSTIIGPSSAVADGKGIAIAPDGSALVLFQTLGAPLKGTTGAYFNTGCTAGGAQIARVNVKTGALVYVACTGFANPASIATDAAGNAYIVGSTAQPLYPTTPGVFQSTFAGGQCSTGTFFPNNFTCPNAVVTKLSADGSHLLFSTYLGGTQEVQPNLIALDAQSNVFVAGLTLTFGDDPTQFPIVPVPPTTPGGSNARTGERAAANIRNAINALPIMRPTQPFISKISPDGSKLIYSVHPKLQGAVKTFAVKADGSPYLYIAPALFVSPSDMGEGTGPFASPCGLTEQQKTGGRIVSLDASLNLRSEAVTYDEVPTAATLSGADTVYLAAMDFGTAPISDKSLDQALAQAFTSDFVSWTAAYDMSPTNTSGIGCIASGANYLEQSIFAPGELMTIYGAGLGPDQLNVQHPDARGMFATELAGTRVLFDGTAAPVLADVSGQINVPVPYALAGHDSSIVDVEVDGKVIDSRKILLQAAHPTVIVNGGNDSNSLQANARLDNGTVNSQSNSAAYKAIVDLYVTGLGPLSPPAVDGAIGVAGTPQSPTLPINVFIGGNPAEVVGMEVPPGVINSVVRIHARVPNKCCGGNLQVEVDAGGFTGSPYGAYIVVH